MVKSFRDKHTTLFAAGKRIKQFQAFESQAHRRLRILNDATCIKDLMGLPSNRFESLGGDREGQSSIRINDQWRICFIFHDGDAYNVEITDYH
ncbi:MAG: type II toxin-antitoxin system RelE/ParE family toxin [Nitrospirae bacterium]|nr:type II toxin-antitoxin system RelE/ParE family toxin [Magnetococcales bacterium]HAT50812.1 plasmid maintenance system killer protein [Alphaproteobacteria bacterium]